jgi:hypothetical protein
MQRLYLYIFLLIILALTACQSVRVEGDAENAAIKQLQELSSIDYQREVYIASPTKVPPFVEVDINSGLPNPSYALTTEQVEQLIINLNQFSVSPPLEFPSGLDFRGLIIHLETMQITVYGSHIRVNHADGSMFYYVDRNMVLQNQLLSVAQPYLPAELLEQISKESLP